MPERSAEELRLPNLLIRNRNFVFLWFAYGVSALGDHLSELALLSERKAMEGHAATRIQALLTFGFFLPFVIFGPVAGWWSDRFSRKWTMIIADVVRAVIVFNFGYLVGGLERWLDPHGTDPHGLGDFSIVIPLLLVGLIAAFFSPARQAMLPTLIRDDQLVRANSLINALGTIGGMLGVVLGGYLVANVGSSANFHVNSVTFLLSAAFVAMIAMSRTRVGERKLPQGVWAPIREGFTYVRTHVRVLHMILLATIFWAAAGVVVSVTPAIVRDVFGGGLDTVGLYRGIMVIGLATGAAVMSIIGPALPVRLAILGSLAPGAFWLFGLTTCYIAFAIPEGESAPSGVGVRHILTGMCMFGIGAAGAGLLVTIMATIQRFVPDAKRGRVFGVADMLTMAAMVTATGALGIPDIEDIDRYVPVLLGVCGLAFVATAIWAWRWYHRDDRYAAIVHALWELVRFLARFWYRTKRVGICTIPPTGAVIVAANHTSGADPLAILASSPRRMISFLVAKEHYEAPFFHWFMAKVDCIPIDRKNPGKSFFTGCMKKLKEGGALGIFPQGTFQEPEKGEPDAKGGVGLLALRTGAPVIPVHISGTKYEDNPFIGLIRRHRMRVKFGPPVDLSAFKGREKEKGAADEASALIMQRIAELAT